MRIENELKKYHQIESIESEGGLIDDCNYMVYLKDGFEHYAYGDSFAIKNSVDLRYYMKDVKPIE